MSSQTTLRTRASLVAGIGYAITFVLAIAANFGVRNRLVVADDPATTLSNIGANESAFRLGIAAFIVIAVIDIVIAWALHVLLRDSAPTRSLLAAWLRLAFSIVFVVATGFLYLAVELATSAERFSGLDLGQREALTTLALDGFDIVWLVGLLVFGLHLVAVASILVPMRLAPRVLGVLLGLAGLSYVADTLAHVILTDYAAVADVMLAVVAVLSIVAELWFAGWLLVRAPRTVRALPGIEEPVSAA